VEDTQTLTLTLFDFFDIIFQSVILAPQSIVSQVKLNSIYCASKSKELMRWTYHGEPSEDVFGEDGNFDRLIEIPQSHRVYGVPRLENSQCYVDGPTTNLPIHLLHWSMRASSLRQIAYNDRSIPP
jgi:hypothetical protein